MKKVYLSGRMSGVPSDVWRLRFGVEAELASRHGWLVVNPAQIWVARYAWLWRVLAGVTSERTVYRVTLRYDLQLLRRCSYISMVGDDWRQSRGARLERMKARKWNIKELNGYDNKETE